MAILKSKCLFYNLSVSYSLKLFNCKCENCRAYKRSSSKKYRIKDALRLKKWLETHQEQYKRVKQKYQRKHQFINTLKRKNLTPEKFHKMLSEQDGKCLICRLPQVNNKMLFIDHNHKTGKVRGLLCVRCNSGLGHFKENVRLLSRAIQYLKRRN